MRAVSSPPVTAVWRGLQELRRQVQQKQEAGDVAYIAITSSEYVAQVCAFGERVPCPPCAGDCGTCSV